MASHEETSWSWTPSKFPMLRDVAFITRHQVARLSLFAFQSVWRVGNATTLYLLHHVSGNHLEQILLDGRHVMWLGIQNRERPDRKTIGPAQRNASIKPQATLLQPWVVSEARVSCQVADAAAIPPLQAPLLSAR